MRPHRRAVAAIMDDHPSHASSRSPHRAGGPEQDATCVEPGAAGADPNASPGPHVFPGLDAPGSIGLALSGGVLRGAAHLGVLSVLDREEIRVDRIAGSSVGALAGAGYAGGVPAEDLMDSLRGLSWRKMVSLPRSLELPGLLDRTPLEELMREEWGLSTFDRLSIPFCAVCCDFQTGQRVVLGEGDVVEAALAASAVGGLFEPVLRQGRLLMDGGTVDNLPVDVVREMGAAGPGGEAGTGPRNALPLAHPGPVVAVDLMADPWDGRPPSNLFEAAHRTVYFLIRDNQPDPGTADVYIKPDLAGLPFSSFAHLEDFYRLGVEAAEEALPRIRHALEQE